MKHNAPRTNNAALSELYLPVAECCTSKKDFIFNNHISVQDGAG